MTFQKEKAKFCTLSITVKNTDKEALYTEIEEAEEKFSSMGAFLRSAVNLKLEAMGVGFRLL